ncbi:MFS transporter, AGZA family, xanthine/uracil permease [Sporothrix schenckii 1099-18]|uniref:MFS transporter, AGZA family, xanthine/uracil permease n=1 Tax=Sporothrix schenckii 1099-18 TaxID=1397361 RepID=A0A0F2LSD6_SPOSC|nr:MFS transporter, AGZA family, xanthine/uracil permease [Sporothrix schenckii 1099-18]KJR80423.1 MFS transporter, AGZA family, xanthine/uracil permease [Sporothrix schenckii 1099-18]
MPVALAPGMGLNAYFTYQVVGVGGTGPVPYRIALTAVFVEGFIFLSLALTGMRQWLIRIIPGTLKTASGVGIGMFLALSGMSYTSGIGIITAGGVATPLTIGGCPVEDLDIDGTCMANGMRSPKMWLGIVSGLITALLMAFRVKAAIIVGIAITTIISWPRNTSVTYFPYTDEGEARWDFFKQIVAFTPIKHVLAAQQWDLSGANGAHFVMALFTFLYVDIVDCTATLYSMARFSGKTGSDGDFPRSTIAYCTDAAFISIGSIFGCSPSTAFIESGAGITEGGRTGLTAIVTGLCFIISVFFGPIFASIPPWATGTTLILVGCLMIRQVTFINWSYIGDAIPSFITIVFMPFSYSVAYGLMAGLFVYVTLNSLIWVVMRATGGTVEPREYDLKEYWTWKPAGMKPAVFRLFTRDRYWGDKESLHEDDDAFIFPDDSNAQPLHDLQTTSAPSPAEKSPSSIHSTIEPPPKAIVASHPHA